MSADQEITAPGPLLKPDGTLAQVGWSRQPLLDCNLEQARTTALRFWQPVRMKRWDYYGLSTPEYFFSFTLADIGYAGSVFAYAVDWATGQVEEATLTIPLAKGVQLPRNSGEGVSRFKNEQVDMEFSARPGERRVRMVWKAFGGAGKPDYCADVRLAEPAAHESLNLVIPIRGRRFYFNRKINCLPASGAVQYNGREFILTPAACLGNLDWGRGVWQYNSHWVWASASGFLPDGHTVGLNLGYGFGDTGAPSEHAVIVDGVIHKLPRVDFEFDPRHYTHPWRMRTPEGAVGGELELEFTPTMERVAKTDLKLVVTEVHQMFGTYKGTFVTATGEELPIRNLRGFAEEHYARW